MAADTINEAFSEICGLAIRVGAKNIKELPGCWEYEIDGQWWVAVNGHAVPMKCSHGGDVPPYHAFVEFNGWPAGLVSPAGGTMAAGEGANEDTFIAAVKLARVRA